jgi:hypothetical protein
LWQALSRFRGGVVVGGIRRFQSSATIVPPTFWWMNSAIALVLLVRDRYTVSIFLSDGRGLLFAEICCAFEQPDRRQMIVAIISDRTVTFFIVQEIFIELY